jgi:hypothetical protein
MIYNNEIGPDIALNVDDLNSQGRNLRKLSQEDSRRFQYQTPYIV